MKKPKEVKSTFSVYNILNCIGEGGSGFVYSAKDDDNKEVAIKILNPERTSKEKLKRFENEYRFCSNNQHPNIIKALDHGLTDEGAPFFVMPRYDYSLRKIFSDITPNMAIGIFKKILDGVEAAHMRGVVHRDLKPENILIRNDSSVR